MNTVQGLLDGYKQTSDDDTTAQAEMTSKAMAIIEFIHKVSETWAQVEVLERVSKRTSK